MNDVKIGENTQINKSIIADNVEIGKDVVLGEGESVANVYKPKIYAEDIVTIGEYSVIPDGIHIGKNAAVYGNTVCGDYEDNRLPSGGYLVKEGGEEQ